MDRAQAVTRAYPKDSQPPVMRVLGLTPAVSGVTTSKMCSHSV